MIHVDRNEEVICVKGMVEWPNGRVGIVYTFLVDGMVIDTGPQCLETDLIPFFEEQSFDLVTLTHSHEDHSGTASWIQENRNVPIYVHPNGINICAQPHPYPKYRQITWGMRKEFHALPLGETIHSRSQKWEVIYTPGHADDHVALFHKETGRLFSGDLYLAPKTKVIMDSESIPIIMDSIRKLLSYEFESMFCCHAGYIKDGKAMLKQKLENLENICGEVNDLHRQGLSIFEIDQRLFRTKIPMVAFSEGQWDSLHIVTSILSHQ